MVYHFHYYRILRVGGVTAGMRAYHRVIELLVESAALYSVVLVIVLVLEVRNELAGGYVQEVAAAVRVRLTLFNLVIATAFLLGNCAYNFGRPHCSRTCAPRRLLERKYQASSLRFGNHSSSQNDGADPGWDTSSRLGPDLEGGSEGSM